MDEEMDVYSSDPYSSSGYYSYYRSRFNPEPVERPPPITDYNIRFVEGSGSSRGKCIDLVFILDCTGSMQKYINSVRDHIIGICDMIRGEEGLNGPDDLRVAVVNYRDHPPQDSTYVYKFHPFTSDIPDVQNYLKGLTASGGGDGPEAVTAAMAATLTELEWRREAARMAVLVADAPPHGIGEGGDQFKQGDPDGHDPLVIARMMAQNGITMFMRRGSSSVSLYNLETPRLRAHICDRELHERLLLRNEQTKQVRLPEVYVPHENAKKNVSTWMNATYIGDAVPNILAVPGKRLTDKFHKQNYAAGFTYTPGGRLPPRRTSVTPSATSTAVPPTASSPIHSSPPASSFPASSPPRRIVSDFKPFGAPASDKLSVFGAPMLSTPGPGGGMFGSMGRTPGAIGGMRDTKVDEDDEDEDEEGARLRKDAISLDQARRIATQAVFRAGRF
ncbi:hypothetical protein I311_04483 [Cryptococcus gattii NT-10]|nr:hypothetical protein I311_04483 [Cryptococcus gattii NT-10]